MDRTFCEEAWLRTPTVRCIELSTEGGKGWMGPPESEESLVKDALGRRRGIRALGGPCRLAVAAAVLVVVGVAIWWVWP